MLPPSLRHLGRVALLAAAYVVVAMIGLTFAIPPGNATAVWPASGVALAAVVLSGNPPLAWSLAGRAPGQQHDVSLPGRRSGDRDRKHP